MISGETFLVFAGDKIEPPRTKIRLTDGGEGVEHRAGQRAMQLTGNLGRGLFAYLPDDDLGL